jgi:flagellar biosynthesis protein FlhF
MEDSTMFVKSFFAATVEDALAEGGRELGPEALLVQSKKAPIEARHLGEYEVVLALAAPPRAPGHATLSPAKDPLAREIAELRRQIDGMRHSMAHSTVAAPRWLAPSSHTARIYTMLLDAEVAPSLAEQIAEAVGADLGPAADFQQALSRARAEIENRITVNSTLGREGAGERVVALAGPPGSGKTTVLAKLAVTYGLAARRPVVLISADYYRIAAAEQLRTYASILGVSFEAAETPRALAQALALHRGKELILIDTPGLAAGDMEEGEELAAFLRSRPDIDTHLVLSASMKSADITRAVDRFELFGPAKLLFTRLDETGTLGPVLNEALRTSKPVSFLTAGQQVPEHLEPATKARISDLLLSYEPAESRAAA